MYGARVPPRKRAIHTQTALPTCGYCRVSTEEQGESGLGLEAQQTAIRAEVDRRGWDLIHMHVDVASGRSRTHRPGLHEAVAHVTDGTAANLVVAKLDRLSRSLIDFASIMAEAEAGGWNLVALDLGVDLSTPSGEFLASVMASAAQWERRLIGQRTREAMQAAKARGATFGRPLTVGSDVRETILVMRNDGLAYNAIATRLNDLAVPTGHGGKRWWASTVRAVEQRQR